LAEPSLTFPHDYRALFVGADAPTVVGGQAVNLWAIVYLDRDVRNKVIHGSNDMAKSLQRSEIQQDDDAPRQDRGHLELIAHCVPEFLRELHDGALRLQRSDDPAAKAAVENTADAVRSAFATVSDSKTATTLRAQGIAPESLIPPEFKDSPITKIANAWKHQRPRVVNTGLGDSAKKKRRE